MCLIVRFCNFTDRVEWIYYYIDIVKEKRREAIVKFSNQVQVDIGSARAKMISSNEPMKLYVEMLNKWKDEVNRLGIKLINID